MLDIDSAIRARAYEIWQTRGGMPGHDLDDWLRAEAEITAALAPATKTPRGASPMSATRPEPKSTAKAKADPKAKPKARTRAEAKA